MAKYECGQCKYITKNKSNYIKHCNTKKHLEKASDVTVNKSNEKNKNFATFSRLSMTPSDSQIYTCEYCNKSISRYNNVARHLKLCLKKRDHDDKLYKEYENTMNNMKLKEQIKILNLKLKQSEQSACKYKDDAIKYEEDAKYYKKMFLEAGNIVKKSVSSLTYIVKNYNNAPTLQSLTINDINNMNNDNTEKEIVGEIISAHKHKTLGQYLGNYIIKIYKKNNPESQSIWNTDDTRLTYLIKELSNNKSSNWMIDKKGHKTTMYLIKPLLDYVKEILTTYQINYNIPNSVCNGVEMDLY